MTAAVSLPSHSDTSPDELPGLLRAQQDAQRRAGAPSCDERLGYLAALEDALVRDKGLLADAMRADYGSRSRHESLVADIWITVQGIRFIRDHLREWMQVEEREVGWAFLPARAEVRYQPLGVIGIISPWNYPVQLAFAPLAGALAAGNRALVKPSELVPATSRVLATLIGGIFAPDHVLVTTGGPAVGEAFSKLPFDHLVFTGSTRVGRAVMRAAAENLTPVTLELGGKSPTIVGEECALESAAGVIAAGKLFNAGQTCIAPDYALVHEKQRDAFVREFEKATVRMYPTLAANADYTSVINAHHHARLVGYIEDATTKGAKAVVVNPKSETLDPTLHKLAPTLLLDVTDEMQVMQEEIFGPILPVKTYRTLDEAIDYVNDHPRPLALYYFGHDGDRVERVLAHTLSGGVSVNATMLHVAQDDLPFGGVGPSGIGAYHGRDGFEAFSKKRPIFYQSRLNTSGIVTPPFGQTTDLFLRFVLGK